MLKRKQYNGKKTSVQSLIQDCLDLGCETVIVQIMPLAHRPVYSLAAGSVIISADSLALAKYQLTLSVAELRKGL